MRKYLSIFLLSLHIASANDLIKFTTIPYSYSNAKTKYDEAYEKYCGNELIDISVLPLKTNRPIIDDYINKKLPSELELDNYFKEIKKSTVSNLDVKNDKIKPAENPLTECSVDFKFSTDYMGHFKNFEIFSTSYYEYTGGAHGMYSINYHVFDDKDNLVVLSQIIYPDKEKELMNLIMREYLKLIGETNENEITNEIKEELRTDNFYLTPNGLVFSYPPYVIAPFSYGEVELTIPFRDLKDIMRLEYLP